MIGIQHRQPRTMSSLCFALTFFLVFVLRSIAGAPASFFEGYPTFISDLPDNLPMAADVAHIPSPDSVLNVPYSASLLRYPFALTPSFSSFFPYPMYAEFYPFNEELRNVAGDVQREDELLTDVSLRFPARKSAAKKLAKNKN